MASRSSQLQRTPQPQHRACPHLDQEGAMASRSIRLQRTPRPQYRVYRHQDREGAMASLMYVSIRLSFIGILGNLPGPSWRWVSISKCLRQSISITLAHTETRRAPWLPMYMSVCLKAFIEVQVSLPGPSRRWVRIGKRLR
jgi:hypothetical protein